jgi:hypothetical protein
MTNPNQQLFYIPSQSLQNSPLKQRPLGPTTPPSGPSLPNMSLNPLTPSLSPTSLQFNQHVGPTSTSAPQTPLGGPPSQLSLQIPQYPHDAPSLQQQHANLALVNEVQPQMIYGLHNQMHLSPPTSAGATDGNRIHGIEEDNSMEEHRYFDDTYPLELGSPFLEK